MASKRTLLRTACFATAILGLAFVGAPAATAICIGNEPIWWNEEDYCSATAAPIIWEDWYVCVNDDPTQRCV